MGSLRKPKKKKIKSLKVNRRKTMLKQTKYKKKKKEIVDQP